MTRAMIAAAVATLATAATAQTVSNVVGSRAESQASALNQGLVTEQQNRAAAQQNQFELNSIRSQNQVQPPTTTGSIGIPGAAPRR